MTEKLSEKSEKHLEQRKVSTVESFCQEALKERIAPRTMGSVKERITFAARKLGGTYSRAKDAWYADPRISISGEELMMIEQRLGSHMQDEKQRKSMKQSNGPLRCWWTRRRIALGLWLMRSSKRLAYFIAPEIRGE